jgi:hypothetical protein
MIIGVDSKVGSRETWKSKWVLDIRIKESETKL